MASQAADCSTSKPVAVVAPCRRVTNDSALVVGRSPSTSKRDDATERRQHQAAATSVRSGRDGVSGDRRRCPENAEDPAQIAAETGPSRRPVEPDVDDLTTCPFYHGNITNDEARRRLVGAARGTYLLRDSQSTDFPLSLSVRTSGRSGVTSLRIARVADRFRLDCAEAHRASMPTFDSALRLVRHFVGTSDGGDGGRCVLVGGPRCHEQPLTLRQPLHRPITDD